MRQQASGNQHLVIRPPRRTFAGYSSLRRIPISCAHVYARQLPSIGTPDAALFPTQKRTAFSASSLCQTVNLIYSRAGVEGATSHSGRRSLITSLASKGVGVRVLAAIAGHSDIRVTQAYIDVNSDMMRAAVELAG